jgi:hypothetical protein
MNWRELLSGALERLRSVELDWRGLRQGALVLAVGALAIGALIGIGYLIFELSKLFPWLTAALAAIPLLMFGYFAVRAGYPLLLKVRSGLAAHSADGLLLRESRATTLGSRADIEETFLRLQTARARDEFVWSLYERSKSEGWKPTGGWSNGSLPSRRDRASSELARLEEQWLGLDR